jgi:hypothetical protein
MGAVMMTDEKFFRAFEEYRKLHPDFFPPDTPIEKQHKIFHAIYDREQQRKNERDMDDVGKDVENIIQHRKDKIKARAESVLRSGRPLEFLMECYRKNHIGHEELARGFIYAFCCQSSATAKGLQPSATGDKGSGKSHGVESTVFLFPQDYIWRSTFSDKALYYSPPKQGSMIFIDEKMQEGLVNLIKRVMTNFQRDTEHRAVIDKKDGVKPMKIPKRQVIIAASTHGAGDDQLSDRVVQLGILNQKQDDQVYAAFEGKRREDGRQEFVEDDDVLVCREMMQIIRNHEFVVKSPKIRFAFVKDRRLINIFFDFLEASAILHFMQRDNVTVNGVTTVVPVQEDVTNAQEFEMFRFANELTEQRFTKAELSLHNTIQNSISDKVIMTELTESDIVSLYGKSQVAIRKLLYGDGGSPANITGGLIQSCNWYVADKDFEGKRNIIRVTKVRSQYQSTFAIIDNSIINSNDNINVDDMKVGEVA